MATFRKWGLTVLGILLGMTVQVHAEHIIGGEIYYDYLGSNQYQITLTLYRDCHGTGAAFDPLGNVTIYDGANNLINVLYINYPGSTFVPVVLDSPCLNLPPNLCIETTSYIGTVTLPPNATGYHISYQRCCRQSSVMNLFNPGSTGLTCTTRIPPAPDQVNSSPRFNQLPPVALCLDEPLVFDHSATDPDGDQLVYALATPYTGGSSAVPYPNMSTPPPYTPVTWAPGYNGDFQINSSPPLAIDQASGVLTVHPTSVGNYVIALSVKEYRNGVLLSETIRDFLFSVVACNAVVNAGIATQTGGCDGNLTVNFTNASSGGQTWYWDFGDPTTDEDVSSGQNPTWTYPGFGTYTVTLIANPGAVCADTTQAIFSLGEAPVPYFDVPGPACGSLATTLTALGQAGPDASYSWDLGPQATPSSATGPVVEVVFSENGPHTVTLTVEEYGCPASFAGTVITHPLPTVLIVGDPPSPQPMGADILFTDLSPGSPTAPDPSFWSLDGLVVQTGGGTWEWEHAQPGMHAVSLSFTTAEGCTASYVLHYWIIPEDVEIPNVFSPNGDGRNDRFHIENAQYLDNELSIYNRWGQVVFHATNYRNQWDGTGLPDGTYYYVFRVADGPSHAGHVTLVR
ncbi:MAG: gliding motility-associated C-terminal domain-containing protein [Flavobacteriales bacterium]|nr:gliding motility-associated C-terminal domain-containing protein [Flavobacteriales bacterium]MEB2341108.1 gliding motility-associated C-terminal domain-containing protein [Flavobacteriia bacterium]